MKITNKDLVAMAAQAKLNSYSPYSGFAVGAAIECASGEVFTGCNVENLAYGSTICAEANAITTAVAAGFREFVRIAVSSDGEEFCMPCGNCRQLLNEFSPTITVLAARHDDEFVRCSLAQLLPSAFAG